MAAVTPVSIEAVASIAELAKSPCAGASSTALAKALNLTISLESGLEWMQPREEVLLELYTDAFEAAREIGLSNTKTASFIEVHQRLVAALQAGTASGITSASAPHFPDILAVAPSSRSPLQHSMSAGFYPGGGGGGINTTAEACALFESLMRSRAAVGFVDPEAASTRFTLHELEQLTSYVCDAGFLKHFLLYRHAFASLEKHRDEERRIVVEAPLPSKPLAAAKLVPLQVVRSQ